MGARTKMLIHAIRNLSAELQIAIYHLPEFLWEVLTTVVIPALVVLLFLAVLLEFLRRIYYIVFPKSAEQLHDEALGCLKQGDNDEPSVRKATRMLEVSIYRDETYLPSHLSLITLLLYQEENCTAARVALERAQTIFPDHKELAKLENEINAMETNPNMARVGAFGSPYFGDAGLHPKM